MINDNPHPTADTSPSRCVSIVSGGADLLGAIEPLWLELRAHHASLSTLWRNGILAATFPDRRDGLLRKSEGGLLVLLARDGSRDVGYCVCTVDAAGRGEVDSLYVTADHRGRGLGRALMDAAMAWLMPGAKEVVVEVLAGNEAACRLYERYGFHPRAVRMRHVPG